MTKVLDFVTVVSRMGEMRVIVVPKRLHERAGQYEGKQLRVRVEDILED